MSAATSEALGISLVKLPENGWGDETTMEFLTLISAGGDEGESGFDNFGIEPGGALPIGFVSGDLVTLFNRAAQLHVPLRCLSAIESQALCLLLDLLRLDSHTFQGRSFTACSTSANLLAISCAMEQAISRANPNNSLVEHGIQGIACQILTARAHESLLNAAAVAGVGRRNVLEAGRGDEESYHAFDLLKLERLLREAKRNEKCVMVTASFGEAHTGGFTPDIRKLRRLCDTYDAWLHIDGALGAAAVLVPDLKGYVEYLYLADSVTFDPHLWLHASGNQLAFFTQHPRILSAVTNLSDESHGLGALPLFAALLSLGRRGYASLVQRNVAFARELGTFIDEHEGYDLLNPGGRVLLNIMLFRSKAMDASELARRLNDKSMFCVRLTTWRDCGAVMIVINNFPFPGEPANGIDEREAARRVLEEVLHT